MSIETTKPAEPEAEQTAQNTPPSEPISSPPPESQTAHFPPNEPNSQNSAPETAAYPEEPASVTAGAEPPAVKTPVETSSKLPPAEPVTPEQPQVATTPPPQNSQNSLRNFFAKAKAVIQRKKTKKLEKILTEITRKGKISNDEVEKLLHVSDATATRYLSQLEREGKIKQSGKSGRSVFYTRM